MEEAVKSTNGSAAPEIKAVGKRELWDQVVAARSAHRAELQGTSQAPEPAAVHTLGAIETVVAAKAVAGLGDAAPAGNGATGVDSVSGSALADEVVANEAVSQQAKAVDQSISPVAEAISTALTAERPDRAKPLDLDKFPHPPKGSGLYTMPTIENFEHLLKGYGIHVSYDVIKKRLVVLVPDHQGSIDNHESVALAVINSLATLNGMPIGQIPAMLIALGDRRLRNVVADWIMSKPWDGVDRLPEFYSTIRERKGYPARLKNTLLRRWLLSAVAAVLKAHGFHCRGVLVLQAKQGAGKTRFISSLVPCAALRDQVVLLGHHLDGANKDSMTTAITHWIVELGELDGTLKKDIARLKSFITADTDKVRRPYGRSDSEYQRRTVFAATVNDSNFLVDDTGNSRFWTIAVESINYEHGIDMQQLFAQMAIAFHAGEQWWLTKDEEMALAEVNQSHRAISLVRERVMGAINVDPPADAKTKALSAIDMLEEAGLDRPTNGQCKECAAVLRELYGDPKKVQGRYVWRVVLANKDLFGGGASPAAVDDDDLY